MLASRSSLFLWHSNLFFNIAVEKCQHFSSERHSYSRYMVAVMLMKHFPLQVFANILILSIFIYIFPFQHLLQRHIPVIV